MEAARVAQELLFKPLPQPPTPPAAVPIASADVLAYMVGRCGASRAAFSLDSKEVAAAIVDPPVPIRINDTTTSATVRGSRSSSEDPMPHHEMQAGRGDLSYFRSMSSKSRRSVSAAANEVVAEGEDDTPYFV
jgi:hypothetical protein